MTNRRSPTWRVIVLLGVGVGAGVVVDDAAGAGAVGNIATGSDSEPDIFAQLTSLANDGEGKERKGARDLTGWF